MRKPRRRHPYRVVSAATVAFGSALALRDVGNVWLLTGIAGGLSLLLAMLWGPRLRRLFPRDPVAIGVGLAVGGVMVALTHAAYRLLMDPLPALPALVGDLYRTLEDAPGPVAALPVAILVVLAEEIVWRGALVDALRERTSSGNAFGVATLAYVLPQLGGWNPALVVAALATGGVWTGLRLVSRSLWAPLVCHLTWSLSLLSVVPLSPGP